MRPLYTFQLLAPEPSTVGRTFRNARVDSRCRLQLLKEAQRLRGRLYVEDGAIPPTALDRDGCFFMPGDAEAWHLLLLDSSEAVIGCARYLVHAATADFSSLRIARSPLANDSHWGPLVRSAIESDLALARSQNLKYVEVGGWAIDEAWRGSRAALEIAVGSFALGLMWGGAIGSCTATSRHGSASILRRLGGSPLASSIGDIPAYYDPVFDCEMELLRFDYRSPATRYETLVRQLQAQLADCPLVLPEPATLSLAHALGAFTRTAEFAIASAR